MTYLSLNTRVPGCWEDVNVTLVAKENLNQLYKELEPRLKQLKNQLQSKFGLRMQWDFYGDTAPCDVEPYDYDDEFVFFFVDLNIDVFSQDGEIADAQYRWGKGNNPHVEVFDYLNDLDWDCFDGFDDDSKQSWVCLNFDSYRQIGDRCYWNHHSW